MSDILDPATLAVLHEQTARLEQSRKPVPVWRQPRKQMRQAELVAELVRGHGVATVRPSNRQAVRGLAVKRLIRSYITPDEGVAIVEAIDLEQLVKAVTPAPGHPHTLTGWLASMEVPPAESFTIVDANGEGETVRPMFRNTMIHGLDLAALQSKPHNYRLTEDNRLYSIDREGLS